MSDNVIGVTLETKDTSVANAWNKLAGVADKLIDKVDQLGKASSKAAKDTSSGFSEAAGHAMKFVGALTGVGSAVGGMMAIANQLKREYENMVQRQKTAADTQVSFEGQLAEAVRNAAGLLSGKEIRDQALKIADDVSADPANVAAAISSTLSAVGPTNKAEAEQAFAATRAAMRFAPEMGGTDIAALAGTAVDIAKRTGSTPEQAIGFLENIGGVARVPSLQNLSGNVAPAVMSVSQFGGSMEDSAALVAALTQGMADTEGRISGTAAIGLAEQLRERLPKMADTRERLLAVSNDPKLRKAFLEGGRIGGKKFEPASFEKKATASIEQLLTPGSMLQQAFLGGAEKIGDVKQAGQLSYDTLQREVDSVTMTSRLQRTVKSAATGEFVRNERDGQTSVLREELKQFYQSVGQTDLAQQIDSAIFEGENLTGAAPVDSAIDRLRSKARNLRGGKATYGLGMDPGAAPIINTPATERELQAAAAMEKLAAALERNTRATEANNQANDDPGARPRPVPAQGLNRAQ